MIKPMLASPGSATRLRSEEWAFEGKWDGYRLLMEADHGTLSLTARSGRDVTAEYPQLRGLARELADHHVVLDGELVVLKDGVTDFHEMQNRAKGRTVEFWAFDLLQLDGHSLLRVRYEDRRKMLEILSKLGLSVPPLIAGDGAQALAYSREQGWEGIVAKRLDSIYQPGIRSPLWIKDKNWLHQEVVIGGWRVGEGSRAEGVGSLLMGIPDGDKLRFVGRVGTGFTQHDLGVMKATLAPLHTKVSPFHGPLPTKDAKGTTFVEPVLVGEVQYSGWTDDRLRFPSWRGLRSDKTAAEVVRE